jgi:vitamin B12 transporter
MQSIVLRRSILAASLCLALAPAARGEDASTLPDVVVTATRVQTPRAEVLAAVTVLTRADIERAQASDLLELLGRQAGIDVVRTGGPGSLSTINLRGGNSNHTLVLIDGLRVNSAVQGLFDFAHLPLAQVERIEIVRGPRAALWGSDAIGGVVQVFTRDADAFAEARAGSYGHGGIDGGVAFGHGVRFGVAAGVDALAGFSAMATDVPPANDKDGYGNRHASLRFAAPLGSQQLSGSARFADADNEYDEGESDIRDWNAGVRLAGALGARWTHELVVGHSRDRIDSTSEFYDYAFDSDRDSVDWLHRFTPSAANAFQLGVNWSRERGFATDSFLGDNYDLDRRNTGVFAAWNGHRGAHRGELSLRHDDNSQFGGTTTANAGWGWDVSEAVRVRASWGQGFRAPNFNELYYPGFGGNFFAGSDDLRPERSRSTEVGLDYAPSAALSFGVSAYSTRVRDLIAFQAPGTNNAINIAQAELEGLELEGRWARGAWTLAGNATWQTARGDDADGDGDADALLRRAPRKAHASLDRRFGNGAVVGVDADAVAARPDRNFDVFPDEAIDLGGYGLVHLRASWPLAAGWELEARVENVLDHDYELVHGFNTPGRSGLVQLRWRGGE